MEEEFWKYWKQRWPNATQDEKVLQVSANYKETRAAFEAGFLAAQHSVQADVATCRDCGRPYEADGYCDHAPFCESQRR